LAEHDHHDGDGHERTDHRPGDADRRLLVPDGDVPPGEEVEQLAVPPEVAPVLPLGPAGLDDGDVGGSFGGTHDDSLGDGIRPDSVPVGVTRTWTQGRFKRRTGRAETYRY